MPSNVRILGGGFGDNTQVPNSIMVGGKAQSSNPVAVTAGRLISFLTTLLGALVVKPFSIPEADWTFACSAAITNTTDVAVKAAAGAGIRNYVTGLQVKNTNSTATEIVIKSASTVIWRGHVGASMTFSDRIVFATPLRTAANAALNFACVTTGASVYVSAQGYSAP